MLSIVWFYFRHCHFRYAKSLLSLNKRGTARDWPYLPGRTRQLIRGVDSFRMAFEYNVVVFLLPQQKTVH